MINLLNFAQSTSVDPIFKDPNTAYSESMILVVLGMLAGFLFMAAVIWALIIAARQKLVGWIFLLIFLPVTAPFFYPEFKKTDPAKAKRFLILSVAALSSFVVYVVLFILRVNDFVSL